MMGLRLTQDQSQPAMRIFGEGLPIDSVGENRGIGTERDVIALFNFFEAASTATIERILANDFAPSAVRGDFTESTLALIQGLREKTNSLYPLAPVAPFEGNARIAGDTWRAGPILDAEREDALVELRFSAGVQDLPLHIHEHSGRLLLVLAGQGEYHFTSQTFDDFDGSDITTVRVLPGQFVCFPPNTVHTFSAPNEDLTLLSYHPRFIEFDDPRQYTLPRNLVMPGQYRDGPLENPDGPFKN